MKKFIYYVLSLDVIEGKLIASDIETDKKITSMKFILEMRRFIAEKNKCDENNLVILNWRLLK